MVGDVVITGANFNKNPVEIRNWGLNDWVCGVAMFVKRSWFEEIGGFDERFTRAQDWELNFRLRENGGIVYFDPRLHVTYKPRPNLSALAKQYFEYGRWRRVVARRHAGTINARYLAPPLTLIGCTLSLLLGIWLGPSFLIPAAIYFIFIIGASAKIATSFREFLILCLVLPTMHFAWGAGFISSSKNLVPDSD